MKTFKPVLFFLFYILLITLSAWSIQSFNGPLLPENNPGLGFSINPTFGYASGKTHEIVYPYFESVNPYLSELIWELDNILLLGASASLNIFNFIYINAGLWSALSRDSGEMNDYDWFYNDLEDWTHRSNHIIFLDRSYLYDLNASIKIIKFKNFIFSGIIGYKENYWDWSDHPVSYIYTSTDAGISYIPGFSPLRDINGFFTENSGIYYEVTLRIPYLALGVKYNINKLLFQGLLQYSFLSSVEDHDHHILRSLHFIDTFQFCQTLGVMLQGKYFFTKNLYLDLTANFQYIFETAGDIEVYNDSWQYQGRENGAAGIRYILFSILLATGISF